MKVHYSKLFQWPATKSNSSSASYAEILHTDGDTTVTRNQVFHEWIHTVQPLIIHCILSVTIVLFVVFYISGTRFSATEHIAHVQTANGALPLPFAPTQPEIVTIISSMIVLQKWALTAWVVPLCWRVAVLLMERHGLRRQDLRALVRHRLLTPHTYLASAPAFIIGTLLLSGLVANSASPILTGSIAWIQQNTPIHSLQPRIDPIVFEELEAEVRSSALNMYFDDQITRDGVVQRAPGLAGIAWGRETEKGIYKRVSRSVEALETNSTIENVTLPYFEVHSIEWIKDEKNVPNKVKSEGPDNAIFRSFDWSPSGAPYIFVGSAIYLENLTNPTNWSSDTIGSIMIKESRLLIFWFSSASGYRGVAQRISPSIYVHTAPETGDQYAFAWITFTAGAGKCRGYQCIVSSPSTIQNNGPITPEPHPLTFQAVHMAPAVAVSLVAHNASIPSSWNNTNEYIEALLVRSYSAAWNTLIEDMSASYANSAYRPSLHCSVAYVNQPRVYVWLALQLSITFLSIVFLILRSRLSKLPLIEDTSLTAFYLDTTSLPESNNPHPLMKGALKIQEEESWLRVKVV
ncbi:unnamed protein product [Rhizoctonia solani]|uniref:Transmembrane protein n=1 Tax=Rhizoctonia solani TaxID=456999 RepID=A0A8H3B7F8_9AGAM|nr:unnamed protein product [Rhizoctonia solani]